MFSCYYFVTFYVLIEQDAVNRIRSLELETWHDLALLYISLSKWHDAEICLSKSKAIRTDSASRCHATGKLIIKINQLLFLSFHMTREYVCIYVQGYDPR